VFFNDDDDDDDYDYDEDFKNLNTIKVGYFDVICVLYNNRVFI
jgi:hypothetical protein